MGREREGEKRDREGRGGGEGEGVEESREEGRQVEREQGAETHRRWVLEAARDGQGCEGGVRAPAVYVLNVGVKPPPHQAVGQGTQSPSSQGSLLS